MARGYSVRGHSLEEPIQDAILEWTAWNAGRLGIKFWRERPPQYIRGKGSSQGFKIHPSEVGKPDIFGVAYGWAVGVEVKSAVGNLSDSQKAWRADFVRCPRTLFWVVRSLEGFIEALASLASDPENPVQFEEPKPGGKR